MQIKADPGLVDIPEDFHEAAVAQFVEMMRLFAEQQLATTPMVAPDGTVHPAIVSRTLPQVTFGMLFVPPRLLKPSEAH